jgi:hypothetical protein
MRIPDRPIVLDGDESRNLGELPRPFFLIFLRHFGCVFCRYQVKQLRTRPELPIIFVCMESSDEAADFRSKMGSPHRFLSDPGRDLYRHFNVPEGTTRQLITLNAFVGGLRALGNGVLQGRPSADPMQLAAAFLIAQTGDVAWSRIAKDVAEIFSAKELAEALARLGQPEP